MGKLWGSISAGGGWQFGERDPEASLLRREAALELRHAMCQASLPTRSVMLCFVGKHLVEQVFSNKCSLQDKEELWLISSFLRHCVA